MSDPTSASVLPSERPDPAPHTARRSVWPSIAVAGALLAWLLMLYGRHLYELIPEAGRGFWLTPFFILDLFPIFNGPLFFIASYVLGLGLIAWAMVRLARGVLGRLALLLCAVAALAFPLLMPQIYGEYQNLRLKAAERYEMRWVTRPGDRYSSAFKQAQQVREAPGRCRLYGWSTDGLLNYTCGCLGVWRYDPATDRTSWSLSLIGQATLDPATAGRPYDTLPPGLEAAFEYPLQIWEMAPSPDKEWVAFEVEPVIYGPSDVILVRKVR